MNTQAYESALRALFAKNSHPGNVLAAIRASLGSLPIVLKALMDSSKKRIGIMVDRRATTGSTDCETVVRLPMVPLPTSSDDVDAYVRIAAFYYGLIHHEVGHINRTDMDAYRACSSKLLLHILNIVDDVWQELQHIKAMPASRRYLDALMMAGALKGMFGPVSTNGHPTSVFTSYLLYRLRAEYRKDPVSTDLYPSAKAAMEAVFTHGVVARMQPVLAQFQQVNSSGDALVLATQLVQFLKDEKDKADEEQRQQQQSKKSPQQQTSPNQDDDEDQQNQSSSDSSEDDSGAGDDDQTQTPSGDGSDADSNDDSSDTSDDVDTRNGEDDSDPGDESDDDSQQQGSGNSDVSGKKNALEQLLDDQNMEHAVGDIHEKAKEVLEQAVQQVDADETCDPSDAIVHQDIESITGKLSKGANHDMAPAQAVAMPIRRLLMKELTALTDEDVHVGLQGRRLSGRHLSRIATNDPRIFEKVDSGYALDTAILLVEDVSASMSTGNRIQMASQANYAAASALHGIEGLEIGAMAFPGNAIVMPFGKNPRSIKDNFQLKADGWSTPMAQGITYGTRLLRATQRRRKIMVVLTDGEPDNAVTAATAIAVAQAQGIEVYGIGILTDSVKNLFPQWTVIQQIDQLPTRLVGLLRKKVLESLVAA